MFRVISNKKVEMTEDEFAEYNKICRSYDRAFFKGEELFKDLFETNDDGIIIYIKSLGNRQFSFEIVFYLMNLMQNQWLRIMANKVNAAVDKLNLKMAEMDAKIKMFDKR